MTFALGIALLQGFTFGSSSQDRDTLQAAPDAVLASPAAGLADGWTWAEATVREGAGGPYWIGWSVGGDTTGATWNYHDRHIPLDGGLRSSTSQMHVTGFSGTMSFSGVKPNSVVGSTDAHELVILLRYEPDGTRSTLTRMHVGNAALPLRFGRGRLFWLGRVSDAASVDRLRVLSASDAVFRRDVVAAVGMHRSAEAAVPVLAAWLESGDTVTIRRAAASWLGRQADAVGAEALERALRADSSPSVRSQAARSLARVASPEVAVAALTQAARNDEDRAVRRSAVQALAEVADDRGGRALADLIDDPTAGTPSSVRSDALSVLGRQARPGPTPRETVDLLMRVSRDDADATVRMQAAQSLMQLPDVATVSFLAGLANDHEDARVQQRAIHALGRAEPQADATAALRQIVWDSPLLDSQRSAARALAAVGSDEARRLLGEIAERHPNADVRRSALQAIVVLETR
ncbi:MAG: HEAT repeat domain-containing protein [Longimicrobiales bacterium]